MVISVCKPLKFVRKKLKRKRLSWLLVQSYHAIASCLHVCYSIKPNCSCYSVSGQLFTYRGASIRVTGRHGSALPNKAVSDSEYGNLKLRFEKKDLLNGFATKITSLVHCRCLPQSIFTHSMMFSAFGTLITKQDASTLTVTIESIKCSNDISERDISFH